MTKPDHAGYAAPLRPEKPETEVKRPDANGGPQPDPPGTEEWLSRFLPEPAPKSSGQTVLSDGIKIISLVDEGPTSSASGPPMYIEETPSRLPSRRHAKAEEEIVFNLHTLVREVHNLVAPLARTRDLLFSWFIAPSLPVLVAGDGAGLRDTLIRLLQCALQVTKQGIVQLSVRKSPGENGPGDLLFSIRDSGSVQRSHAGLFRAWQLAADNEGVFNLEYSPSAGTQVSFTVHFALPTDAMVEEYYQRQQGSDYFALASGFLRSTDQ